MHKKIIYLFLMVIGMSSYQMVWAHVHKPSPIHKKSVAIQQEQDLLIDMAFENGMFQEPITPPEPTRFQRFLKAVGLPIALKFVALKNYIAHKFKRA